MYTYLYDPYYFRLIAARESELLLAANRRAEDHLYHHDFSAVVGQMTDLIRSHTAISLHHLTDEYTLVRPHGLRHYYIRRRYDRDRGTVYDWYYVTARGNQSDTYTWQPGQPLPDWWLDLPTYYAILAQRWQIAQHKRFDIKLGDTQL